MLLVKSKYDSHLSEREKERARERDREIASQVRA